MSVLKRKDIKKYKDFYGAACCPVCLEKLTSINAVLDHDHTSGHCRAVIDRNLNQFIGKCEQNYKRFMGYKDNAMKLPVLLRCVAAYLEGDYSYNPLHPGWVDLQIRKFGRETKNNQVTRLTALGISEHATTSVGRTKQFKQFMYRKENLYE